MKIIGNGSARRLVLAAALSTGAGFGTHASAQEYKEHSYLIDLNTRTAASLGNDVQALAINDAGQVGDIPTTRPLAGHTPSSPAPMA